MILLRDLPQYNYPAEYLVARIKGRRIGFQQMRRSVAEGFFQETKGSSPWSDMLEEYEWIYGQTESRLRKAVTPFFQFIEMKTLFLCLRHKTVGQQARINSLLGQSLLSDALRKRLLAEDDIAKVVGDVISALTELSADFSVLDAIYRTKGLAAFEAAANRLFLEYVMTAKLAPAVHTFFRHTVDHRNILSMAKRMRWQVGEQPDFVAGGAIPLSRLQRAWAKGTLAGVVPLIAPAIKDTDLGMSLAEIDRMFLAAHAKRMRQESRGREPVGQVMSYLWRRYIAARHQSLFGHGGSLPRRQLAEEMIQ